MLSPRMCAKCEFPHSFIYDTSGCFQSPFVFRAPPRTRPRLSGRIVGWGGHARLHGVSAVVLLHSHADRTDFRPGLPARDGQLLYRGRFLRLEAIRPSNSTAFMARWPGQLGAAGFGGVVYAWFIGWRTRARKDEPSHSTFNPRGWWLVVPGVLGVWLLFVVLLHPQLLTNYHGRPPASADVLTSLGMLVSFGVCGVALMFFHGLLSARPVVRRGHRATAVRRWVDPPPFPSGWDCRPVGHRARGDAAPVLQAWLLWLRRHAVSRPRHRQNHPHRQILSGHQKPR